MLYCHLFIAILLFRPVKKLWFPQRNSNHFKEEANQLEETYIQTRATILNDTLGYVDTREFWFSIDTLKKIHRLCGTGSCRIGQDQSWNPYLLRGLSSTRQLSRSWLFDRILVSHLQGRRGIHWSEFSTHGWRKSKYWYVGALNYGQGGKPPTIIKMNTPSAYIVNFLELFTAVVALLTFWKYRSSNERYFLIFYGILFGGGDWCFDGRCFYIDNSSVTIPLLLPACCSILLVPFHS